MSSIVQVFRNAFTRTNAALSLELENTGCVARDHLASERTFLAYLRTSLSLVSIGIAVTQLFQIPSIIGKQQAQSSALYYEDEQGNQYPFAPTIPVRHLREVAKLGKPIGGAFIALGIAVLLLGCRRYFVVQNKLTQGKFPPSRVEVTFLAFMVTAMIVGVFSVILARRQPSN
ncbi:hypothetical protein IE53DRAFT_383800 [Violaceomyces palustris]|uniref:Uncharacterized protein n=1 Tax=Violaceomyces palustris TaxID=1673888 RepID=A0ACD0P6J5_9BASI|nr:hypothetical protein IE53DRAFT_383800 [Violaceomyces palustris]